MAKKSNSINTSIFFQLKLSEKSDQIMREYWGKPGVPAMFLSNPGLGKTTTVYIFAALRGYKVVLLRGNSTTHEEVCGYDTVRSNIPDDVKTTDAIVARPSWFAEIMENHKNGFKSLLFLDELTTAMPDTQAALLNVIFERRVGNEFLPADTLVVSAGNYANNLSNMMELMAPTMNRFALFNLKADHTDLDTFLSRFTGALVSPTGEVKDLDKELISTLKKLDEQETKFSRADFMKAGEFFQRAMSNTMKSLMTTGEKVVDLGVSELKQIYSDTTEDAVYGFPTMRTIDYTVFMATVCWFCFGKAGICSDNFRKTIEGLCGIGISRDRKTKEPKITYIAKEIHVAFMEACNDVEKLSSTSLPKYETFFADITKDFDKSGKSYTMPELCAILSKLNELKNDSEVKNIDRPIDPVVISRLCSVFENNGAELINMKITSKKDLESQLSPEIITGLVVSWNNLSDTMSELCSLVNNPEKNYGQETKKMVKDTVTNVSDAGFKLMNLKKILAVKNKALSDLIVDVRDIKE